MNTKRRNWAIAGLTGALVIAGASVGVASSMNSAATAIPAAGQSASATPTDASTYVYKYPTDTPPYTYTPPVTTDPAATDPVAPAPGDPAPTQAAATTVTTKASAPKTTAKATAPKTTAKVVVPPAPPAPPAPPKTTAPATITIVAFSCVVKQNTTYASLTWIGKATGTVTLPGGQSWSSGPTSSYISGYGKQGVTSGTCTGSVGGQTRSVTL